MKERFGCNQNRFQFEFLCLYFLAVTVIAFYFPPSGDDLGWATSDGMELLQSGFKDYNGRYLGNLSALFFTRISEILPLVKGFTLTLILCFIQKFTCNKSKDFLYLSAVLLVIPTALFKQAFVWTAGFSNYCFSALIIMLNLYLLIFKQSLTGHKKTLRIILVFVLGVAGQLFMETYTVFLLIFSVALNVDHFIKHRKLEATNVVYMTACVIGAVIMFTNGVYAKVCNGDNTYQSMSLFDESLLNTFLDILEKLLGKVSLQFCNACFPAIITIMFFAAAIFKQNSLNTKRFKQIKMLFIIFMSSVLIFIFVILLTKKYDKLQMLAGFVLLYMVLFCSIIAKTFKNQKSKRLIVVYFVLIVLQAAPLAVVSPVGPRCFNGIYIISVMIVKEFWEEYKTVRRDYNSFFGTKMIKSALAVLLVIDLFCYSQVFIGNNNKIELIRSETANGNITVELEHTPFRFMVHSLDTENTNAKFKQRFCEYYHLPDSIEITYKE